MVSITRTPPPFQADRPSGLKALSRGTDLQRFCNTILLLNEKVAGVEDHDCNSMTWRATFGRPSEEELTAARGTAERANGESAAAKLALGVSRAKASEAETLIGNVKARTLPLVP